MSDPDNEGHSSGARAPEGGGDKTEGTNSTPAAAHPPPRLDLIAHIREQIERAPAAYANPAKLRACLERVLSDLAGLDAGDTEETETP